MEHKKIISNYDLQVDIGKKIFLDYDQEMFIHVLDLLLMKPGFILLT